MNQSPVSALLVASFVQRAADSYARITESHFLELQASSVMMVSRCSCLLRAAVQQDVRSALG